MIQIPQIGKKILTRVSKISNSYIKKGKEYTIYPYVYEGVTLYYRTECNFYFLPTHLNKIFYLKLKVGMTLTDTDGNVFVISKLNKKTFKLKDEGIKHKYKELDKYLINYDTITI